MRADLGVAKRIEEKQTDERIIELYDRLKDEPKVQWKDSIKKVAGVPTAEGVQ